MQVLPENENFLRLEEAYANFAKAQAVVLPVPYEATTTYNQGTVDGPAAILAASHQVELYDAELDLEPFTVGVATLPSMQFGEKEDHEAALDAIGLQGKAVMQTGKFLLALGGEHSITIPLVEQAAEVFPELGVLQLDAHSDLRDSYEGSSYNHACVMARVNEICDFVGVGVRSGIAGERGDLRPGARLFYAHEMRRDPQWPDKVLDSLPENVYLTLDLDYFDPSIMPAVGTPEPGGFHWNETLQFLHALFEEHNVVACDVVELSPIDGLVHPNFLAARLVYKLIAHRFFARIAS